MVVVATRRDERGRVTHHRHQLEAEHATVEIQRAVDVGHLEVHVSDVGAGRDRAGGGPLGVGGVHWEGGSGGTLQVGSAKRKAQSAKGFNQPVTPVAVDT